MSNEQEEQISISPIEDTPSEPAPLHPVSRASARLAMNWVMPSYVARLYLYLFGEFDRDVLEAVIEHVLEKRRVVDEILDKKKVPLRALYDYLIETEYLEDQALSEQALEYIDAPDLLQERICIEDEVAPVEETA